MSIIVNSESYALTAGHDVIVSGAGNPLTVHIPTGTTATIYTTCSSRAQIDAGTADWIAWGNGSKAGPFMDVLLYPIGALKISSAAGGTVNIARTRL
ncbi:hypothetical protein [Burkholderia ambifaria]|jgi:hypothetical protein